LARISTHVLDLAAGTPAAGIPVSLYRDGELLGSAITNVDGRTSEPMLSGDSIETGAYELIFETGGAFFETIAIRFQVTDSAGGYHVPLLLAPYGYSTYRGS